MSDEFSETDLDTPTEQDLDSAYGSKFLSSTDVGGRKIKTKIAKIRKEEMRADDGKKRTKFVLFLDGLDKAMVLNATNKDALVSALGRKPADWIGASIGLYVDPNVMFAGRRTSGLRLRVLLPPAAKPAAPKPEVRRSQAAPKQAAAPAPNEEPGDPGFDPDLNDPVPEFEEIR